jgi:hypothetical protein
MSYVLNYISEGEHQQQDFKMRVDDSKKLARTFAAFANSDGGRLLIGVKDNGQVCGVNAEEEVHMLEAAARFYCKPPVDFNIQAWKVEHRTVLEVNVPFSSDKPHIACNEENEWKAYIRLGDKNLVAPAVLLELWKGNDDDRPQRYFHTEKEKRIFTALESNTGLSLSQLVRITRIQRPVMIKLLARFIRWDLMKMEFNQENPTYSLK